MALAAILCSWGTFLIVTTLFRQDLQPRIFAGKILRGAMTETIGLVCWLIGFVLGAKPGLALPVLILGLGAGGTAGVFHSLVVSRLVPTIKSVADSEKPE